MITRRDFPELELGHSARWKIQRYPGAKWVPIHKEWGGRRIVDVKEINPVITNCLEKGETQCSNG